MTKPWYKSLSIVGAITAAVGYLSDPRVFDVLHAIPMPEETRARAAGIITAIGTVAAIIGIRRTIPDATLFRTDSGAIAVHDPSGALRRHIEAPRNEFGETAAEEARRNQLMLDKGTELKRLLETREGKKSTPGG